MDYAHFPRYRFLLLTVRNAVGPDVFEAGFYLHDLRSLKDRQIEANKFYTMSKEMIRKISPDMLHIPEVGGRHLSILAKLYRNDALGTEFNREWGIALTRGFDRTTDAGLLKEDIQGWPVLEGKYIHQFNHNFARPQFVSDMSAGLAREAKKRVYKNKHREFYHSFRLAFRSISSPTNMRTVVSAIIPPQRFHANSMSSIVLTRNRYFIRSNNYNRMTAYLCGVLNSMSFDFAARSKVQMNVAPVIKTLPAAPPPRKQHYHDIAELAAKLSVGTDEFEGFAESLRIDNVSLPPPERIHTTARLDALVAHAYDLTRAEYQTVLDSFKFDENPILLESETADFNDNKTLRQFYGEVRRLAPAYYDDIAGGGL